MTKKRERRPVIAIDGPAGAGKSTLAARLAQKLGYVNIESGAMYRALALKAIEAGVSFAEEAALGALAHGSRIELEPARGEGNRVLLDGRDVSQRIRQPDVTEAASRISVHPAVRQWMVARQRELGAQGGVVMEGRDIGTQVFPDAEVKIFLDATPEVRGQRRSQQQPGAAGQPADEVLEDLRRRDLRDRSRVASPLVPAPDAVILDSTSLSLDQVVARVEEVLAAGNQPAARPRRSPRVSRPH
jgi:cytidylate kinase